MNNAARSVSTTHKARQSASAIFDECMSESAIAIETRVLHSGAIWWDGVSAPVNLSGWNVVDISQQQGLNLCSIAVAVVIVAVAEKHFASVYVNIVQLIDFAYIFMFHT